MAEIAGTLKAQPAEVPDRLKALLDERKSLQNEVAQLRRELAMSGGAGQGGGAEAKDVNGIKFLAQSLTGVSGKDLRQMRVVVAGDTQFSRQQRPLG